jgi:hypothetical protein
MMAAVLMRLERSAEVLDLVGALALAVGTSTNRDDFATFVNTEETACDRTGRRVYLLDSEIKRMVRLELGSLFCHFLRHADFHDSKQQCS